MPTLKQYIRKKKLTEACILKMVTELEKEYGVTVHVIKRILGNGGRIKIETNIEIGG